MSKTTKVLFVPNDSSKSSTFHFYYERKTSERYLVGSSDESKFDPTFHSEILRISGISGSFNVPGTRLIGTISAEGISTVFQLGYKVAPSQGRKMMVNDSPNPIYVHTTFTIQEEFEVEGLTLKPALSSKISSGVRKTRPESAKPGRDLRKHGNDNAPEKRIPQPRRPTEPETDESKGAIAKIKPPKRQTEDSSIRKFKCNAFYNRIITICNEGGIHPPTLIPNVSSFDINGDSKKYAAPPDFLSDAEFKIVETTDDIGVMMDCVVCPHDDQLFEGCSLIRVGVSYIEYLTSKKKVAFSKRSLAE